MRHRVVAALLAAMLLLAACGGDDDDSGSDAGGQDGTVTKAEYIARADTFCKTANARAKEVNERAQEAARGVTGAKAQLKAIAPIFDEGLQVQRESLEEFKKIEYPPADRAVIERLFAEGDRLTDLVEQLGEAAEAQDVARFRAVSRQQDEIRARTRVIQREYGFKECGSGRNEAD